MNNYNDNSNLGDYYIPDYFDFKMSAQQQGALRRMLANRFYEPRPKSNHCPYYLVSGFHEGLAITISPTPKVGVNYPKRDARYGYVKETFYEMMEYEIVIPCKYHIAYPFSNGLAIVGFYEKGTYYYGKDDNPIHYGYIDKEGKQVIPCIYDKAFDYDGDGLVCVEKDGVKKIITIDNKNSYEERRKFSEDLTCEKKDGKHDYINVSGEEDVVSHYDVVAQYNDGLAWVKKDGKYGFIDEEGKEVIPCIYHSVRSFHEGLAVASYDRYFGYIDKKGKCVIPFIYGRACDFSDGKALVSFLKNDPYFAIDRSGKCTFVNDVKQKKLRK